MSNAADEQRIENLIEEDQRARERALDVTQSFLVQAPAGSGKTELLIRRMLALLAQVDRPERILAMTFTRKAAAEMRERIVAALRAARADAPLTSPHEQPTRDLALAVLAQDARQQWHLIEQPSRLRMMTIDAFCAQLLRQTPLTSRWGAMPSFEEFVQPRYEAAVREALRDADDEAQPFWCEVLKTLGNNGNRLVETMSALLMKREQWLPLFGCALRQDQRTMLQSVLSVEVENELTNIRGVLQRMWSATERETLRAAMRYAAGHLDESPPLPSLSPCPSPASGRGEAFPSSLPLAGEGQGEREREGWGGDGVSTSPSPPTPLPRGERGVKHNAPSPGKCLNENSSSNAAMAQTLRACAEREELWPLPEPEALADWQRLADWLLTAKGSWRKKLTKNEGFPSQKEGGNAVLKKATETLLSEQSGQSQSGQSAVLARVHVLPSGQYHDDEWRFIDALLYLLPRLLARFQLMCARDGVIDFAEAQLAAIEALGEDEAPSDVLLTLDMRIEHLLIDEFQDTSRTQMTLLRKLTAGWQFGDGRTLFAVGDPMQSIYRFRQADVGLFLEAQATRRINDVPVTLLTLTRNFRSQARLIDWTNAVFPEVFARDQDVWRGAVAFKASAPTHAATEEDATVRVLTDAVEEGAYVAKQTAAALKRGARDVAILVRARTHLNEILPALRTEGIAFTAVRLDRLGERQAVTDVLMLTHTLVQPDDELAWLSVLRAPWCGLTLSDLAALARARGSPPLQGEGWGGDGVNGEGHSISPSPPTPLPQGERGAERLLRWSELLTALPEQIDGLSEEGHRRLTRVLHCWREAYETSHDRLAQRVYRCWLALQGPSCLNERADVLALARFFECLDAEEVAGDIPDWPLFKRRLEEAFLPEEIIDAEESNARVKVMTLHQAKGLQFDTVMMPGLGRGTGRSETPLLRWRQRPQGLLLAARRQRAKAAKETGAHSGLDDYLAFLEKEEERYELARLLYVGVTRAERQLILTTVANIKEDKKATDDDSHLPQWAPPREGSAMALWWEALCAKGEIAPPAMEAVTSSTTSSFVETDSGLPLRRLPGTCFDKYTPSPLAGEGALTSPRPSPTDTPFQKGAHSPPLSRLRERGGERGGERVGVGMGFTSLPQPLSHKGRGEQNAAHPSAQIKNALSFHEANIAARHVGTVVHDWLSRVGIPDGQRLQDWTPAFLEAQRETIAHGLAELGVPTTQRNEAARRVIAALSAVRDDPFAQWLLDPTREAARNEWALSAVSDTSHADNHHVRLDRTFIDDGFRWIVDYKTAETDAADIDAWLDAEVEKYRPQMEDYAALMKRFEEKLLKRILYYPLLRRWKAVG